MEYNDWAESPYTAEPATETGRYVVYPYAMSFLLVTFKRGSDVVYVPPGKSRLVPGLPYLALTLILGWCGVPWGPIYTIESIARILGGGIDVTEEVTRSARAQAYLR